MKKLLALLAVSALTLSGAVFAQEVSTTTTTSNGDYVVDDDAASVTETITIKIPPRVALHLQEETWLLDLDAELQVFGDYGDDYYQGCFLIPKAAQVGLDLTSLASIEAFLELGVTSYPAVMLDVNGNVRIDDTYGYLKGGLFCVNSKIIQKFSNDVDGWDLKADVTIGGNGSIGQFVIADAVLDADVLTAIAAANLNVVSGTAAGIHLADGSGTTGGFLDDLILEGFYFDGTEVAGDYIVDVTFTLTGKL